MRDFDDNHDDDLVKNKKIGVMFKFIILIYYSISKN